MDEIKEPVKPELEKKETENNIPLVSQFPKNQETRTSYSEEIEKIYESNKLYTDKINMYDLIFRDFLTKKFHIKKDEEYTEIINFFIEKNKPEIASFCHTMIEVIYSGEKIDDNKVRVIAEDLKNIIYHEQTTLKQKTESLKDLIKIKLFKKKSKDTISTRDTKYLSKQVKKIIDSELENKQEVQKEIVKSKEIPEIYGLSPTSLPEYLNSDPVEFKYIQTIDDLARIKSKIRERKREITN